MSKTTEIPEALRAKLEQPHRLRFWGEEYTVTPRVCPTAFGNGKQLVAFQPLDTRPEYYILFVDSYWSLDNCLNSSGMGLADHYDEICTALEDEWGSIDDYEEGGCCEGEEWPGFPVLSESSGAQWFALEMPGNGADKPAPESEARR